MKGTKLRNKIFLNEKTEYLKELEKKKKEYNVNLECIKHVNFYEDIMEKDE